MGSRRQHRRGRPRRGSSSDVSPSSANARRNGLHQGNSRDPARASRPRLPELCELSPFSVFCALYLGITETDSYAEVDSAAVCRRFDLSKDDLQSYLDAKQLTEEHLHGVGFDIESARFDIKVAPEGISRVELARTLFADFQSARNG